MTQKKVNIVGMKLSQLLRVAVNDCKRVERSKKYRLNMLQWFSKASKRAKICHVCMAGSVMLYELPKPRSQGWRDPDLNRDPEDYDHEVAMALHAIDVLRQGGAKEAYRVLYDGKLSGWGAQQEKASEEYDDLIIGNMLINEQHAPWVYYEQGADILEAAGL